MGRILTCFMDGSAKKPRHRAHEAATFAHHGFICDEEMVSLKLVFARTLNAQFKHVVDMVLTNVLVMYGCVWGMFDSRRG